MRVLILGGTAEARELAAELTSRNVYVVSSLAGRVSRPRLPVGDVRIGGFGGVDGLVSYLRAEGITHLVDATHPFAVTMTQHGDEAARVAGVPCVRFARPGWSGHPAAASWHWVSSYDEARATADQLGARPFLTTGRQTLEHFVEPWRDREALVRVVEPPSGSLPPSWTIVHDRGPYNADGERLLMRKHRVDVLLTKDSGGSYTAAKLDVASELEIPVVVLARPNRPEQILEVTTIDDVLTTLHN